MTEESIEYVYGHNRNQLVHAVIWPKGPAALAILYDTDGVIQGDIPIKEPVKGSVFASMMPEGYQISFSDCGVMSMSGEVVVATRTEFNTVVVTERAEVSMEETIRRMAVKAMRQERRREREQAERRERRQAEREREPDIVDEDTDPVIPVDSATEPTTEPKDASDA